MTEVYAVVEGQTELEFIELLLKPPLAERGVYLYAHAVTTRRDKKAGRAYRGGLSKYSKLKHDLHIIIKQHGRRGAWVTTMVDFYALPRDFPGYDTCRNAPDPYERVACLENALEDDISYPRLLPYIQLHEFEALLFCDLSKLGESFPCRRSALAALAEETDRLESPELIDDTPDGAPSKRIIACAPEYANEKASAGPLAAAAIGLKTLRNRCPHFGQWVERLESLAERT